MTEEPDTKYMRLAAKNSCGCPKNLGTPCRCKTCHVETKIRLKRGVSLKKVVCFGCGHHGFERFTKYDQEHKKP
jgi:Zn ribbon nucleic-acid-binding protein